MDAKDSGTLESHPRHVGDRAIRKDRRLSDKHSECLNTIGADFLGHRIKFSNICSLWDNESLPVIRNKQTS